MARQSDGNTRGLDEARAYEVIKAVLADGAMPTTCCSAPGVRASISRRRLNPSFKKLLEEAKFPLETWSGWESEINKNGGGVGTISKQAADWLNAHKTER